MGGMNLKYLEYVVEISRCGSINKAAKNLYLSQPNLSNAVKNLEAELGYSVFHRKNSGIELTPAGRLFLQSAKKIIQEMEKINRIPDQFAETKNISLSCTYSSSFMQSFMAFKRANRQRGQEDFFKETGLIQSTRDIIEQSYRLGVIYCFDQREEHHRQTAAQYNLEMSLLVGGIEAKAILSRQNPLSRKKELEYTEIARHPFAFYQNFEYEDWLKILGFGPRDQVLHIFDRGGLIDTVKQGSYLSVIMNCALRDADAAGCVLRPIRGLDSRLNVYLLRERNYQLNRRERQFVAALRESLRELL